MMRIWRQCIRRACGAAFGGGGRMHDGCGCGGGDNDDDGDGRNAAARARFGPAAALVLVLLLLPAAASMADWQLLPSAYGHGLGLDRIQSITAGDQKITILVEMPQEFVGGDTERITITATEDATGRSPAGITYLLGVSHGGQTIFRDYFSAPDGVLLLDVETARGDNPVIVGARGGGPLSAWHPVGDTPVRVDGSAFGDSGLYTFDVAVHSMGGSPGVIDNTATHYADLSVIESASHEQEASDGSPVTFSTKSYFDGISGLAYDAGAGEVLITMPFDWSEARMSHIPVVHTEVHFPKDFLEFRSPGYEGYVNGVKLFRSSVIIDDYTLEDDRTVHFVLLQDHVRLVKNEMKKSGEPFPDDMTFRLKATETVAFPLDAYTISEEFLVNLSWDPPEIRPGEETTFVFTIRDGRTNEPLRNSEYTFLIMQDGEEIHRASGNARIGGQFVKFTFGEEQTGPTVIKFEDIRGTGQETEFGILVVPEFGPATAAMLVLAGATAAMLYAASRRGLRPPGIMRQPN